MDPGGCPSSVRNSAPKGCEGFGERPINDMLRVVMVPAGFAAVAMDSNPGLVWDFSTKLIVLSFVAFVAAVVTLSAILKISEE